MLKQAAYVQLSTVLSPTARLCAGNRAFLVLSVQPGTTQTATMHDSAGKYSQLHGKFGTKKKEKKSEVLPRSARYTTMLMNTVRYEYSQIHGQFGKSYVKCCPVLHDAR